MPPSDSFVNALALRRKEAKYPVKLLFCPRCLLVQLSYSVNPKRLFGKSYVYQTGFSAELRSHFGELAKGVIERFRLSPSDLVVDIGANDGTLLEGFRRSGVRVLGVEPSPVAQIAVSKGIPTLKGFFGVDLAKRILREQGRAKVITATNVFAHVRELRSFVNGVKQLLDDSGVFITESHYLLDMVRNLEYDAIYLEHLRYYSLSSLVNLFEAFDMDVFHAERAPTHGGSILTFACRRGAYKTAPTVRELLDKEAAVKLNTLGTLRDFSAKVDQNRRKLRKLLTTVKASGNRIVGIGAPAKSTTLLNYCKIGPETLDYLLERNQWKVGKYSPGMKIRIADESLLFSDPPAYALLLSWNLRTNIVPKLRENGYSGKIIVPVPEPEVVAD